MITAISCRTTKTSNIKAFVNTKANTEYKKSIKVFSGKLNTSEYNELKNIIEKELNVKIPPGKSILINFNQKAPNCISLGLSNKDVSTVTDNRVWISSGISSNNNAADFYVFTDDSFHKDIYQARLNFKLDSGFFYNNVFTLHENCTAIFVIKPNGDFLKYYGEDSFSEVKYFLEKE